MLDGKLGTVSNKWFVIIRFHQIKAAKIQASHGNISYNQNLGLSPMIPWQFQIAMSDEVEEHWPVGWPVETPPIDAAPALFEKLDDVAINQFALKDALDAIQGRVEIPFLYDQNSLARAGIDLNELKVTLVRKRMMYYTVIRKLVSQNKPSLSLELRKDENDKPFLWIAPSQ